MRAGFQPNAHADTLDELKMLIRRAWLDMMKAREQGDKARELRAERRMNSLLGRLSARTSFPTEP